MLLGIKLPHGQTCPLWLELAGELSHSLQEAPTAEKVRRGLHGTMPNEWKLAGLEVPILLLTTILAV